MSSMNLSREQQNELLFVGFNQDYDAGFRIYNCDPFKETFRRDFSNGGIGIVEMLFRCNILAVVGGGRNPRYPPNKVMIWDDHQSRNIGELSFRSEVKAVKLRRDRVVVVLQNKIYVYNFADLNLVDHIETIANPKGLCSLCPDTTNTVLACPGVTQGTVRVELYDIRKTTVVPAHEADLAQICVNLEGTLLATASDKGTLIRIFDTQTGQLRQELRRGADRAEIYSICFSPNSHFLACSSDKCTVHVFALSSGESNAIFDTISMPAKRNVLNAPPPAAPVTMSKPNSVVNQNDLKKDQGNDNSNSSSTDFQHQAPHSAPIRRLSGNLGDDDGTENYKSSFSFMRGLLPKYFSSEWSFAQFRVPETRTICAFGADKNTIIVVGADGSFYKAAFDANGECEKTSYSKFIQSDEDD